MCVQPTPSATFSSARGIPKPISLPAVLHSFLCPRCDALAPGHIAPPSQSQFTLPLSLPPGSPSSSLQLPPYTICRKFTSQAFPQTHPQGNLTKLSISLDTLFRGFAVPVEQAHKLALYPPQEDWERSEIQSARPPRPRPRRPSLPPSLSPALKRSLFYGDWNVSLPLRDSGRGPGRGFPGKRAPRGRKLSWGPSG